MRAHTHRPCRARRLAPALLAAAALLAPALAGAQDPVEGLWQTIDDKSGLARAEVRLTVQDGTLVGWIVRLLQPDDDPDSRCQDCPGARRNQPVVGLRILGGLHRAGSDPRHWTGGEILDPESGATYHAQLLLDASGRQLQVRGYVLLPIFGRSQVWRKVY